MPAAFFRAESRHQTGSPQDPGKAGEGARTPPLRGGRRAATYHALDAERLFHDTVRVFCDRWGAEHFNARAPTSGTFFRSPFMWSFGVLHALLLGCRGMWTHSALRRLPNAPLLPSSSATTSTQDTRTRTGRAAAPGSGVRGHRLAPLATRRFGTGSIQQSRRPDSRSLPALPTGPALARVGR